MGAFEIEDELAHELVIPGMVASRSSSNIVRLRFFDQVGHQMQKTYQNYEQNQQKLGTFLVNKVL